MLTSGKSTTVFTVGHSNHDAEAFLTLLHQHGIKHLVDVRSSPYSRFVPQANREVLDRALEYAGISYIWMGDSLGGKPGVKVAEYDLLRESLTFRNAIIDLVALAEGTCTAVMCSEADHRQCHRHWLISLALLDENITVLHIQPDGSLVDEESEPKQLTLF